MGTIFVLIAAAFKAYADDRGWAVTWWKGLIALVVYVMFVMAFYGWGTLIGENEASAGFKLFLATLFVAFIIGVGLWRLLSSKSKGA